MINAGSLNMVLQRVGRSLMMPVSVLPAAVLMLRLGQPDLLDISVLRAAGQALFDNLPLLFAVGVAIGFARKADGTTALSALVGYLVFDRVAVELAGTHHAGVFGGMAMGLITGLLFERFHTIELPGWLAFFGGKRFVPLVSAAAGLFFGLALGTLLNRVSLGQWPDLGWVGAGIYGLLNRILLPFGLHHIPNSLVWFGFGDYHGTHGEIPRYFAGDPHAGGYLAGFFPVLMFGLPGAALAMWRTAEPAERARVGKLMASAALASFVTGVSEPIEFAFIFASPLLYGIHTLLTGISMALLYAAGAQLGFGFSAGLIDMLLNGTKSNTRQLPLIIGLGVIYFFLYYGLFRFLIPRLNLSTPGRPEKNDVSNEDS